MTCPGMHWSRASDHWAQFTSMAVLALSSCTNILEAPYATVVMWEPGPETTTDVWWEK